VPAASGVTVEAEETEFTSTVLPAPSSRISSVVPTGLEAVIPVPVSNPHGPLGLEQLADVVEKIIRGGEPDRNQVAADKLASVPAERREVLADRILLYVTDGDATLAAVRSLGLEPLTSLVRRSTLEDVFLRLTGRRLED